MAKGDFILLSSYVCYLHLLVKRAKVMTDSAQQRMRKTNCSIDSQL